MTNPNSFWQSVLNSLLHGGAARPSNRRRLKRVRRGMEPLEDRRLLAFDFGDAPDLFPGTTAGDYNTVASDDGPSHIVSSRIFMGASVDGEMSALPNDRANGDDLDQALPNDEDGLNHPDADLRITVGSRPSVNVIVNNTTGRPAMLYGWIDTNGDGTFDNDTERAASAVSAFAPGVVTTLTFPTVPSGFFGKTYARFRLSTDDAAANPIGSAGEGEVEDYVAHVVLPSTGEIESHVAFDVITDTQGNLTNDFFLREYYFGASVASIGDLDGDGINDMAVGVPGDDTGGDNRGAVHILFLDSDGSVKHKTMIASGSPGFENLRNGDDLGHSLTSLGDLDGDGITDLAVGAHENAARSGPLGDSWYAGAVYVLFLNRDGTAKGSTRIASGSGGLAELGDNDQFGHSLAFLGDLDADGTTELAVGATGDRSACAAYCLSHPGTVYILSLNGDGNVTSSHKIFNTEGGLDGNDTFGYSLASIGDLDGDGITELAVGVAGGGTNDKGSVHVLFLDKDAEVKHVTPIDNDSVGPTDVLGVGGFGLSLASLGDLDGDGVAELAVGDLGFTSLGDAAPHGAAFILFLDSNAAVKNSSKILGGDTRSFASALTSLGDLDSDGTWEIAITDVWNGLGAVHIASINTDGTLHGILNTLEPPQIRFGDLPTSIGDLNGDGTTDLAVFGGPGHFRAVNVLFMNPDGMVASTTEIREGTEHIAWFGDGETRSLTAIGDLDGDGVTELALGNIGRPSNSIGPAGEGVVHVLFLNRDGTLKKATRIVNENDDELSIAAPFDGTRFGSAIAALGDLDGDGVVDMAVGEEWDDHDKKGAVHVIFMNTDGTVKVTQKLSHNTGGMGHLDAYGYFGSALASLGDLDGDGITELAVGAVGDESVYVLFLTAQGTTTKIVKHEKRWFFDQDFGASLSSLGDLNGDGVRDLAVGAPRSGVVYVLLMNADGTVKSEIALSMPGPYSPRAFSASISNLGDITNDGVIDLAVTAPAQEGYDLSPRLYLLSLAELLMGDLGDAPDLDASTGPWNYSTLASSDGPMHGVNPSIFLGFTLDAEPFAAPSGGADGDDLNGDDEDGLLNPESDLVLTVGSTPPSVDVMVTNITGQAATLYGWIDTNIDGVFDLSERTSVPVPSGLTRAVVSLTFPRIPAAVAGKTYARFRLSTDGAAAAPTGSAVDGEVEDYLATILSPTGVGVERTVTVSPSRDLTSGSFGKAIASLGDVDGDGIDDLAVGSDGAVNILMMNADGTFKSLTKIIGPSDSYSSFGIAVAPLGDLNNDGVPDVAVGAFADEADGAVHVIFLNADGTSKSTTVIANGIGGGPILASGDRFGSSVTSIGDLNKDGIPDLAVGAVGDESGGGIDHGAVYVLFMNTDGTAASSTKISKNTGGGPNLSSFDRFGSSVAGLGDLDGDSVPDLAVGSPRYSTGVEFRSGAVYVLFMKPDGTAKAFTRVAQNTGVPIQERDEFGSSIAALGDLDDDGITDLAIGAKFDSTGGIYRGAVYVMYMNRDGTFKGTTKIAHGLGGGPLLNDHDWFGTAVAALDDLDGNGIRDLAVGSLQQTSRGQVHLLYLTREIPDFGDAPDTAAGTGFQNYNTLAADNGPSHTIDANIYLGTLVDGEPQALANVAANGDDTIGTLRNDEDGLVKPERDLNLTVGQSPSMALRVTNTTGREATLYGWIDVDMDGVFEFDERAAAAVADGTIGGVAKLVFPPIPDNFSGTTYARFRFSTDAAASEPTGPAINGEVEDYVVAIFNQDFGDAPDTGDGAATGNYNTRSSDNGPVHTIDTDIFLGARIDGEFDAIPSTTASTDDLGGATLDDEDGLIDPSADLTLTTGLQPTVRVTVTNATGKAAMLYGWIDTNNNGLFEPSESASAPVSSNTGGAVIILTFPAVPASAAGTTYARFRLSTDPAAAEPTGIASDGEVEDYVVTVLNKDFGDAPDWGTGIGPGNYNTLAADGGPSHVIDSRILLGTTIDVEADAFPNMEANGDDVVGGATPDDEDGLVDPQTDLNLTPGVAPTVDVTVTNTTGGEVYLFGWVDFNYDGLFDNVTERASAVTLGGVVKLTFPPVPVGYLGATYARFRVSTDKASAEHPTGPAPDGEVEDYVVKILNLDHGDAPDTGTGTGPGNYNTLRSDDGPAHQIVNGLYLGSGVDNERDSLQFHDDGRQRISANGDDEMGVDDEDGLVDATADLKLTVGEVPTVRFLATNHTGRAATLYGWIDFNMDGDFLDLGEANSSVVPSGHTNYAVTLTFPQVGGTHLGPTYARFRLTTDISTTAPTGLAKDGEVEDYVATISLPIDPSTLEPKEVKVLGFLEVVRTLFSADGAFGTSLYPLGNLDGTNRAFMAVGRPGPVNVDAGDDGSVEIAVLYPGGIAQQQLLARIDGNVHGGAQFGSAVAAWDASKLAIGASRYGVESKTYCVIKSFIGCRQSATRWERLDQGAVFIVGIDSQGDENTTPIELSTNLNGMPALSDGDKFGYSVANIGDVDGNNVNDLAVGAIGEGNDQGAVYILMMNPNGTVKTPVKLASGVGGLPTFTEGAKFGKAIASLGEINGDPIIAVGTDEQSGQGSIYILRLGQNGLVKQTPIRIGSGAGGLGSLSSSEAFGSAITAASDLNGDGVSDLIVGAPGYGGRGAIHVLYMNDDNTVKSSERLTAATVGMPSLGAGERFGSSLAILSEKNAEGLFPLAVGSPGGDGRVRVLTLQVRLTPATLADAVASLPEAESELTTKADSDSLDDWIRAIETLPPFPRPNEIVTINLNLDEGTYDGEVIDVPSGYRLVINGDDGPVVFTGASPALTVVSGDILVTGNVTFTNATDAPTILVLGGTLTLRNAIVEETSTADRPAIKVTGGVVDLGTSSDPGGNTIIIVGAGELIHNLSPHSLTAIGNSYRIDTEEITSNFSIEDEIYHYLDGAVSGLVSYVTDSVYLTIDEGDREVDLQALVADLAIMEPTFAITSATGGTAAILSDDKTARFTSFDDGAASFSYSVAVSGQHVATRNVQFQVRNVAPTTDPGADQTVNEGSLVSFAGSFIDPGTGDTHTMIWDFGDGNSATGTLTPTHTYADNGTYTVSLTVTDDDGGAAKDTLTITVGNVAPEIDSISGPVDPVAVGTEISVSTRFSDPGKTDTHTAVWDWGDGSTSAGAVSETNGSGSVSGSHAYSAAGVYTVTLTVTDDDTGAGTSFFQYVVVYDPSAGFVTGGGWINSPAGAYPANASLTGKSTFGFNSKYQNGNNVPTGNTEFQFKVADFNFKSNSYEWLVVSGAKARYRGLGTVNGIGGFGFELTAWDGQVNGGGGVDRFRIKIWDKNQGDGNQGNGIVYDNMLGASDEADPTTTLGGGSIVIHKSAQPLLASGGVAIGSGGGTITQETLNQAVDQAVDYWRSTGIGQAAVSYLQQLHVEVADLPDTELGIASDTNYVWIDLDASGYGWRLDSLGNTYPTLTGGMDLLSVVAHELGHKLGLEHSHEDSDVMAPTLDAGVRKMVGSFGQPVAFFGPSLVLPVSLQLDVTSPSAHGTVRLPNLDAEENQARDQLFARLDYSSAKQLVRRPNIASKSQSDAPKKPAAETEDLLAEDLLEVVSLARLAMH